MCVIKILVIRLRLIEVFPNWCCVASPQSNMYKSPEAIRSTRELWFRVELGAAEEVPRKVIPRGCIVSPHAKDHTAIFIRTNFP